MKIKVIKRDESYYALASVYKKTIKSYKVKYSWKEEFETFDYNRNLLENNFNLLDSPLDLFSIPIELEEIRSIREYITLILITEDGYEYPFHIGYDVFYNISTDSFLHKIRLKNFSLNKEIGHRYKFFIKGVYGDEHKAKLINVLNPSEIIIGVPDKESLSSEVYDLIIELNGEQVHRCNTGIFKTGKIDFSIYHEEFCKSLKFNILPKFSPEYIKEIEISSDNKLIVKKQAEDGVKKIEFFTPNLGATHTDVFYLKYKVLSTEVNAEVEDKEIIISYKTGNKDIVEISNISSEYDFTKDVFKISWDNKSTKVCDYIVEINGLIFKSKENCISIPKAKTTLNNSYQSFAVKIYAQYENSLNKKAISFTGSVLNYIYIYSSNVFKPVINYSDVLYANKQVGILSWTAPEFDYYSVVEIKSLFQKKYLDEYSSPWINNSMFDNLVSQFDEKYEDYNKPIEYDFNSDGSKKLGTVNESFLGYDAKYNGGIVVEGNRLEIPIWFCEPGENYSVKVKIYDRFNSLVGEASTTFIPFTEDNINFLQKDLMFERNQFMQFGETGTVGEFYKIENHRPADVENAYNPDKKTFTGFELEDFSNLDFNFNSLYYYLNSNEITPFTFRFKRSSNFYSVRISIKHEDVKTYEKTIVVNGNDFEDNYINIDKTIFKEGVNKMLIETFNSANKLGRTKELNFYLFNNKPETPVVNINSADYFIKDSKCIINKKMFELEVSNNKHSTQYAGWIYKEVHFFFKNKNDSYLPYPDYVIQTNKNNGNIVLKNRVPIENGEYSCKAIAYDYSGNASDAYEFDFTLISEMKVEPWNIFSNKVDEEFKWTISKSLESDGFYWFYEYSSEGVNFTKLETNKVESPYCPSIGIGEREYIVSQVLPRGNGFYRLCVYEFNKTHPEGLSEYLFKSPVVEMLETANPSKPITVVPQERKTAVFNKNLYNEWAYTSNLDDVIFEFFHTDVSDEVTEDMSLQKYKVQLIEPSKSKSYSFDILETPTTVGVVSFKNVCEKAGIASQEEGVWEIRFITIDKYGNSNEANGYFSYYVNVVKRNPSIYNLVCGSKNSLNYFGLNSERIMFSVNTSKRYEDIINFNEHKNKFAVTEFFVAYLEVPSGSKPNLTTKIDVNGFIDVANPLTESDKITNSRDGKYRFAVIAEDCLKRESEVVDSFYFIDTIVDSDLNFISGNKYYTKSPTITATASNEVEKVYYKFFDSKIENIPEIENWEEKQLSEITSNSSTFFGLEFKEVFETDGEKTLVYKIEEESGNISEIKKFEFRIDSITKLMPLFDYTNKIFYNGNDEEVKVSWDRTNKEITDFSVMVNKVTPNSVGGYEITNSYSIYVGDTTKLVPIGASENNWQSIGEERSLNFNLVENSAITTGYYMVLVKGLDLYGSESYNEFMFQVDYDNSVVIDPEITNNKITIDSNTVSWTHIPYAKYYEISYNGKNWIKVMQNYFNVNDELLSLDSDGNTNIYLRWISKTGMISETSKIRLRLSMEAVEKPVVQASNGLSVTSSNKILEWKIILKNPEKVERLYYSFNKTDWESVLVKGSETLIANSKVEYPLNDGVYDIYVVATDGSEGVFNKSEISHSRIKVFASEIPKPVFKNITNGTILNNITKLYIENKKEDVVYYIYVNGKLVNEGYEISSSKLKRFDITVKAERYGIGNIETLISEADEFHVFSLVTQKHILSINNSKVLCNIDEENLEIEIVSMPNIKDSQIILYREKSTNDKWKTLLVGDKLSLMQEWEFYITTFSVL